MDWSCGTAIDRGSLFLLKHRHEGFLGDFDRADGFHPLLALFLLFEQFSFARDVSTVAFGRHVLAHGLDGFARDDFAADGCLERNFELVSADLFAEFLQ